MSAIVQAIWRAAADMGVDWKSVAAAGLATGVNRAASFTPYRNYTEFRNEALTNGANRSELAKLYRNAAFLGVLRDVLESGDIERITAIREDFGDIDEYQDMAVATKQVLSSTLSARELSWLAVTAADLGEDVPQNVNGAAVTAALNAAGWTWNGNAWEKTA